ncbi:unnamed protein product [Sphenostylis stenocarpa]|uniref:Uncharacterized protein n=1 Tax=Sphenostylis stenocarpa TaxID=92480 RepID=A0AA86S4T5_9FABA|nr:unnamed protein product [Sphenostylis stenocarpa]
MAWSNIVCLVAKIGGLVLKEVNRDVRVFHGAARWYQIPRGPLFRIGEINKVQFLQLARINDGCQRRSHLRWKTWMHRVEEIS